MPGQHELDTHFGTHFGGALHDFVEFFHFEPQQHTIAIGSVGTIADGPVIVLNVKTVQLQDELTILYQLLILRAAVSSATNRYKLLPSVAAPACSISSS